MENLLVAVAKAGADTLALSRPAPIGSRGDGAVVSGKAHQNGVAAVALAHELANVQLAPPAHLRRPRVAQVRIVRPDNNLRTHVLAVEIFDQRVECLHHVLVAQVPGRNLLEKHRAIILLGVFDQARILFGVKKIILCRATMAPPVPNRPLL